MWQPHVVSPPDSEAQELLRTELVLSNVDENEQAGYGPGCDCGEHAFEDFVGGTVELADVTPDVFVMEAVDGEMGVRGRSGAGPRFSPCD